MFEFNQVRLGPSLYIEELLCISLTPLDLVVVPVENETLLLILKDSERNLKLLNKKMMSVILNIYMKVEM